MKEEALIKEEISQLQNQERELNSQLSDILYEKEQLIETEMKEIMQKEKRAQKLK